MIDLGDGDGTYIYKKPEWSINAISRLSDEMIKLIKHRWLDQMTAEDWAILYLTQNSKYFENLFRTYMADEPDEYLSLMIESLKKCRKSKQFTRAAEYAAEFNKTLNKELIQKLYDLTKSKKNTEAALAVLQAILNKNETDKENSYAFLYEKFDEAKLLKHFLVYGGSLKEIDKVKTADSDNIAPRIAVLAAVIPYIDIYNYIVRKDKDFSTVWSSERAVSHLDSESFSKYFDIYWDYNYKEWKGDDIGVLPDSAKAAELLDHKSFIKFLTSNISKSKETNWDIPFYIYIKETDLSNKTADSTKIKAKFEKITQMRTDWLFKQFLEANVWDYSDWQSHFLNIYIDRRLAERLVWEQNGKIFTIKDGKLIDTRGNNIILSDKRIKLAHPMEMDKADVIAWQNYLAENGLEQPFLQMREPVIESENIKPNRYEDIEILTSCFEGMEKHGIGFSFFDISDEEKDWAEKVNCDWYDIFYDELKCGYAYEEEIKIGLNGCDIEYRYMSDRISDIEGRNLDVMTKLGEFEYETYNRQVNHIVSLLDKWTVLERIPKDDLSVMDYMESATHEQLSEYIKIAIKNKAVNLTAKLLDFKKEHFSEFEGVEEFRI